MVTSVILAMCILAVFFSSSTCEKPFRKQLYPNLIFLILVLQATLREEKKLRVENAKLKKEVEELKQELIQAEIRNGGD